MKKLLILLISWMFLFSGLCINVMAEDDDQNPEENQNTEVSETENVELSNTDTETEDTVLEPEEDIMDSNIDAEIVQDTAESDEDEADKTDTDLEVADEENVVTEERADASSISFFVTPVKNRTAPVGSDVTMFYTWRTQYQHEKISVKIYDSNNKVVKTYNNQYDKTYASNIYEDGSFVWDTTGLSTGTYTAEAHLYFYSFSQWNESPKVSITYVKLEKPFDDVKDKTKYYYDAVYWAKYAGITQGTSATTFSPNAFCKRYQFVLFLWRKAGKPEPTITENPFVDVYSSDVYYKAVLWALEKGITTGTSDTTFDPKATLNRAQVVTFLYRAAGEPAVNTTDNPFIDVSSDKYYYVPVLWAVEKKVTTGVKPNLFQPGWACERGQVVTFLYRAR